MRIRVVSNLATLLPYPRIFRFPGDRPAALRPTLSSGLPFSGFDSFHVKVYRQKIDHRLYIEFAWAYDMDFVRTNDVIKIEHLNPVGPEITITLAFSLLRDIS